MSQLIDLYKQLKDTYQCISSQSTLEDLSTLIPNLGNYLSETLEIQRRLLIINHIISLPQNDQDKLNIKIPNSLKLTLVSNRNENNNNNYNNNKNNSIIPINFNELPTPPHISPIHTPTTTTTTTTTTSISKKAKRTGQDEDANPKSFKILKTNDKMERTTSLKSTSLPLINITDNITINNTSIDEDTNNINDGDISINNNSSSISNNNNNNGSNNGITTIRRAITDPMIQIQESRAPTSDFHIPQKFCATPSRDQTTKIDLALKAMGNGKDMVLLSTGQVEWDGKNYSQKFHVKGKSTDSDYTILVGSTFNCSCPDYWKRIQYCKHMAWVMMSQLGFARNEWPVWQRVFTPIELYYILVGVDDREQLNLKNPSRIIGNLPDHLKPQDEEIKPRISTSIISTDNLPLHTPNKSPKTPTKQPKSPKLPKPNIDPNTPKIPGICHGCIKKSHKECINHRCRGCCKDFMLLQSDDQITCLTHIRDLIHKPLAEDNFKLIQRAREQHPKCKTLFKDISINNNNINNSSNSNDNINNNEGDIDNDIGEKKGNEEEDEEEEQDEKKSIMLNTSVDYGSKPQYVYPIESIELDDD